MSLCDNWILGLDIKKTMFIEKSDFPFSDEYMTLDNLDASYKARKDETESVLK